MNKMQLPLKQNNLHLIYLYININTHTSPHNYLAIPDRLLTKENFISRSIDSSFIDISIFLSNTFSEAGINKHFTQFSEKRHEFDPH